ncbi:MAG: hypothetical protein K2X93_16245 [Candidatus Obscuribacterales bacterium]|nr:hypothetical protein [Candidatus Obscuribacterales bacterium]
MPNDSINVPPVSSQQRGIASTGEQAEKNASKPGETKHSGDETQATSKTSATSPWNPLGLLSAPADLISKAANAIPSPFPSVEIGGDKVVLQPVKPSDTGQVDLKSGGKVLDIPMFEQAIRKLKDSPDPVLEMVKMLAGGLDNLRGAKLYQTVYGDYQLQVSLNHSTQENMVDKSMGQFSSGPVTMDPNFGMRASLRGDGGGGAMLQLSDFVGVHPTVEGPRQTRAVLPGSAVLFKGSDGDYHMSVNGSAEWGLVRKHWTKSRDITIDPENVRDPFLRGMMQDATDIDRALADFLRIQQSKDILSVGIQRSPLSAAGSEQFEMQVRSRSEKHVPLGQDVSAGLPVKIDSVDLGADVSASLSYSRQAGIALRNINGVKINIEPFAGFKQVVSPTMLTFERDNSGKAAVGLQFVLHDGEGKPGEPVSFSIPFSRILEELGKR